MDKFIPVQEIGGKLTDSSNKPSGEWNFSYNEKDKITSLQVNVSEQSLVCELDKSGVLQLISWLQTVQLGMPD